MSLGLVTDQEYGIHDPAPQEPETPSVRLKRQSTENRRQRLALPPQTDQAESPAVLSPR